MRIVDVWINCPSADVADAIADALISKRLVACSNRYGEIASRYFWKGKIEEAIEVPLLVKTRLSLFEAVKEETIRLHPYETPSVLGVEISAGNQEYIDWVYAETEPKGQTPGSE